MKGRRSARCRAIDRNQLAVRQHAFSRRTYGRRCHVLHGAPVEKMLLDAPLEKGAADPVRMLLLARAIIEVVEPFYDLPGCDFGNTCSSEGEVDGQMPTVEDQR